MSRQREDPSSSALRLVVNTVTHPIEYAKVLIQIGYEPIAPRKSLTLLRRPALKLPNIFEYVSYIKSVDGFVGCYRGLTPKIMGNIVSIVAHQKVMDVFDGLENERQNDGCNRSDQSGGAFNENDEKQKFIRDVKKDVICRFTAIVISQPFHVVAVRMMAQFVGREKAYSGCVDSVVSIYKESGLTGFFSGLIPRVLGDIISLMLASTLSYAVSKYVDDKEIHMYTSATMTFLASALTYPFQVISNCMAVTGSGLAAGNPPFMPVYVSWIDCWSNLSQRNELKRGSSLLIRYYSGPQVVLGN